MPSARRAPRQVFPSTATARNRSRGPRLCLLCDAPGRIAAHAGRDGPRHRRRGPSRARVKARGSRRSRTTRIVSHPVPGTGPRSGPKGHAAGPGLAGWPA